MHTRHGFTLIELLVVIAIIAILAAILFPIFTSAKNTANRTSCLNNLKQMGAAITRYADDNGGYLPDAESIDDVRANPGALMPKFLRDQLQKYTGKNQQIWRCPSDGFKIKIGTQICQGYCDDKAYKVSYQNYSDRDIYPPPGKLFPSDLYVNGVKWPVLLSTLPKPSAIRLIRDAAPFHSRTSGSKTDVCFNELYADGHCKTVKAVDGNVEDGCGNDRGGIL